MTLQAKKVVPFSSTWQAVHNLYQEAFPTSERLPFTFLHLQSLRSFCKMTAYYDGDQLAAFSYVITNDSYAFVLYLAVDGKSRGKGYGSQVLNLLKQTYAEKEIILNIESLDDLAENSEQRQKRLAFYQKTGWQLTDYLLENDGQTFAVLSQSGKLNTNSYLKLFKSFSFGLNTVQLTKMK